MKLLWEGSWTSGNITIPDLPYYSVFVMFNSSAKNQSALAVKAIGKIRGVNGVSDSGTYIWFNSYNFAFSGTTLSYDTSVSVQVGKTLGSSLGHPVVSAIYGLL